MKFNFKLAVFCAVLPLGGVLSAQMMAGGSNRVENGTRKLTINFSAGRPFAVRPVIGAPYSAEQVSETTQTLADGTHINQTRGTEKIYRDSQGRQRTERTMMAMPRMSEPGVVVVEITDAVAGYRYVLDDYNRVAHRIALQTAQSGTRMQRAPAPGTAGGVIGGVAGGVPAGVGGGVSGSAIATRPTAVDAQADPNRPSMTHEDLGTQTVDGVLARGTRRTTTYPIGLEGNDRPLVSTNETWLSEDLKVVVLSKFNDPRTGEHTTRLTNISRAEPDPALFQPPVDYKMVDETGQFTIEITRPLEPARQ